MSDKPTGMVTMSVVYHRHGAVVPSFEASVTLPLDAPAEKRDACIEAWIAMSQQFLALQKAS